MTALDERIGEKRMTFQIGQNVRNRGQIRSSELLQMKTDATQFIGHANKGWPAVCVCVPGQLAR